MMVEIELPAQLNIRCVSDLREQLMQETEDSSTQPPVLDASRVERVDTAGAQLVAAALLGDPPAAGGLRDPSPAMLEALRTLGLLELCMPVQGGAIASSRENSEATSDPANAQGNSHGENSHSG